MTRKYWHRAARSMRDYVAELEETESSLSDEVLALGKQVRHQALVIDDYRESLAHAHSLIAALEQDRETDRIHAYKLGLVHSQTPAEEAPDTTLPHIESTAPDLETRWFVTKKDALEYAKNAGFRQRPERRRVWVDLAWREEWSLRVPTRLE